MEATIRISAAQINGEITRLKRRRARFLALVMVLTVVSVAALAVSIFARPMQVNGMSMEPTLATGDVLLVDSLRKVPVYGDVVVFTVDGLDGMQLVKRVIGLPGDEIHVCQSTGQVYRNGEAVAEPYVQLARAGATEVQFPVVVPEGSMFVLGDNRVTSIDSRSSLVGMVPMENVIGSVWTNAGNVAKAAAN